MREAHDSPTFVEALGVAFDNLKAEMFTGLFGKVDRYYDNQEADVIPVTSRAVILKDGSIGAERLPVLPRVPVCFPEFGGFFQKGQLERGDTVAVLVFDQDVGNAVSGSSNPVDARYHGLGGAVCFPVSFKQGGAGPFDHLAMGSNTGKTFHVKKSEICAGSENPTDNAGLASKIDKVINAFLSAKPSPTPSDNGATIQAAVQSVWNSMGGSVKSQTLKVDD